MHVICWKPQLGHLYEKNCYRGNVLLRRLKCTKMVYLRCTKFMSAETIYCWFSHDVIKIQTKKLSILPRFYFQDALEQLKTNFHKNFRFKRVLEFVIEYAWISKLLREAAFTWRPRELSCRLKKNDLFQGILLSKQFMY